MSKNNLYTEDQFLRVFGGVLATALKEMENLEPVQIVRCKDCDNWNDGITTYDCYWDKEYHYDNPGPDDYCSRWTERKEQ